MVADDRYVARLGQVADHRTVDFQDGRARRNARLFAVLRHDEEQVGLKRRVAVLIYIDSPLDLTSLNKTTS